MNTLNEKQKQALSAIESPNFKQFFGIFGCAGVGKTYLLGKINNKFRVAFTAPTNKAVVSLKNSGCNPDDCMTIYSFLGLVINESTGKVTIDKKGRCKSENYDIVIIDEASMINDDICDRLRQLGRIKIIFTGDCNQLPPPKATHSPVFKIIGDNHIVLTEQMRQKNAENPIHRLLTAMRTAIDTGDSSRVNFADFKEQVRDDEKGLNVGVVTTNNSKQWEKWLIKAFTDKRGFETLSVAYSNVRVDQINALIHASIYPDSETYCVGEKLTFQAAKKDGHQVVAQNGDVITVESVVKKQEFVNIGNYKVVVDSLLINGEYLTPCRRNQFNNWLEMLKTDLNNPRVTAGYSWGELYLLRDRFADLRHSYCSTVHKAQGSSLDAIFCDMQDIYRMPEPIDIINRCIYTAISRARHVAVILD